MTPDGLGFLMDRLNRLGFEPSRTIAGVLDTDDRRVRRWREGSRPIPDEAGEWLEQFDRFLRTQEPQAELEQCKRYLKANPPPQLRGRRDRPRSATPGNPWAREDRASLTGSAIPGRFS